MASADRFRVRRTPKGGVSIGWSLYKTYRECPQLFNLTYCQDGDGIRPRQRHRRNPSRVWPRQSRPVTRRRCSRGRPCATGAS